MLPTELFIFKGAAFLSDVALKAERPDERCNERRCLNTNKIHRSHMTHRRKCLTIFGNHCVTLDDYENKIVNWLIILNEVNILHMFKYIYFYLLESLTTAGQPDCLIRHWYWLTPFVFSEWTKLVLSKRSLFILVLSYELIVRLFFFINSLIEVPETVAITGKN